MKVVWLMLLLFQLCTVKLHFCDFETNETFDDVIEIVVAVGVVVVVVVVVDGDDDDDDGKNWAQRG